LRRGRKIIAAGSEAEIYEALGLQYIRRRTRLSGRLLRRFDFTIGSIHGQSRLDRQAQTERLVRAASNPFITVMGHMTGRQRLRRPGYDLDIERVLAACAERRAIPPDAAPQATGRTPESPHYSDRVPTAFTVPCPAPLICDAAADRGTVEIIPRCKVIGAALLSRASSR